MRKYEILTFFLFLVLLSGCSKNSGEDVEDLKPVDKLANLKSTGDSANDILSNDNFDRLLIEIGYVKGFKPSASAIADFEQFLKKYTFKEQIDFEYRELVSSGEDSLSLKEISDLESENRTAYNSGKTLAVYIYFADAPSEDDDGDEDLVTLGAVYRNTSMVVHESTVHRLSDQSFLVSNADIESATLNHEFGHLFGLVDLGTTPVNDHEDSEAENHCNVDGCLMRAELQFGGSSGKSSIKVGKTATADIQAGCILYGQSVMKMLERQASKGLNSAPGLDAECMLDLQGNGGR